MARVSICMPTLNSMAFLDERLESIDRQTLQDWELVVVDSASDDATLEKLAAFAESHEQPVRIHQAPRDGIYTNINRAIEHARSPYIYIATSDDTMADDCLDKLASALDEHPSCGLAHSPLRRIHRDGTPERPAWWERDSVFARSSGDLLCETHVRRAPYDGMLHLLGESVYVSLTQLLIRRSVIDDVGLFASTWGSVGDFEWDMRVSLMHDTVHVADTWASWRLHDAQATASAGLDSRVHSEKVESMIEHALQANRERLDDRLYDHLAGAWGRAARDMREFFAGLESVGGGVPRKRFVLAHATHGSWAARRYLRAKLPGHPDLPRHAPWVIRRWLEREAGNAPVLRPAA
jgi:glycosyltransferase involved in cell wall biosynthesis